MKIPIYLWRRNKSDNSEGGIFVRLTDWVSEFIGTPMNIGFWIFAVVVWFCLFIVNPNLQNESILPGWFTSNAFNFPLNTVTTLVELYIGFLVAAAANRAEKHLRSMLLEMREMMVKIEQIEENILSAIEDLKNGQ